MAVGFLMEETRDHAVGGESHFSKSQFQQIDVDSTAVVEAFVEKPIESFTVVSPRGLSGDSTDPNRAVSGTLAESCGTVLRSRRTADSRETANWMESQQASLQENNDFKNQTILQKAA